MTEQTIEQPQAEVKMDVVEAAAALARAQSYAAQMSAIVGDDEKLRQWIARQVERVRRNANLANEAVEQWSVNVRDAALGNPLTYPNARNRTRPDLARGGSDQGDQADENGDENGDENEG